MAEPISPPVEALGVGDEVLKAFKNLNVQEISTHTFVDSEPVLASTLDALVDLPVSPPSLYIDLEGVKLSRNGSISILQIFVLPQEHTYLIDVHHLQERAFSIPGQNKCKTLKSILESADTPKVIFDVRNDSDALFHLYGIKLSGIEDLQLMQLASRQRPRKFVNGLARCIERDCQMTYAEQEEWRAVKEKGVKLFAPEKGGSYEVFNNRPISDEIVQYCVQDVHCLGKLWQIYDRKLSRTWRTRVRTATIDRITFSQGDVYLGEGKHKALAPSGW